MRSATIPTIGRRLWFYASTLEGVADRSQAFDAGVIFVHGGGLVNLDVTRHDGSKFVATSIEVRDPPRAATPEAEGERPSEHGTGTAYATWMPYQQMARGQRPPPNLGLPAAQAGDAA